MNTMPSKKKKYNARFPAGRIKKIMQTDEEVGKVAQAVPVIISRTLELFVESLLTKALQITSAKNAKTLSPSHMKQCILSEQRFDFLKDLVKSVQDNTNGEEESLSTVASGMLTAAPHRPIPTRRKSSSSFAIKQEGSTVKEEIMLKEEPEIDSVIGEANCSAVHLNPNAYSAAADVVPALSIAMPQHNVPPLSPSPSPILVMDEDYDT